MAMRAQLQALSLRIQARPTSPLYSSMLTIYQTVRSSDQMANSLKDASRILGSMNRQMNLPALQRIAMDFERENDVMEQRQEFMDDAIDEATGADEEEEEEEIVNQVLDELGIETSHAVRRT